MTRGFRAGLVGVLGLAGLIGVGISTAQQIHRNGFETQKIGWLKARGEEKPNNGMGPGIVLDGFDHGGAFADALCVLLRGRIPRAGNHGKHQQQGLHDFAPVGPRFASTA